MSQIIYTPLVKDNDLFGQDLYRANIAGVPLGFRPTLSHTVRQSANKNNNNATIEAICPVVRLVDGLAVSTDSWKATFKFTALQHIESDAQAELAFDAVVAYVKANKEHILAGTRNLNQDSVTVESPAV